MQNMRQYAGVIVDLKLITVDAKRGQSMLNFIVGWVMAICVACSLVGIFIILFAKKTDEPDFMEEDRTDLHQEGGHRFNIIIGGKS